MNFKSFVSEIELEEKRRNRQAEWEKVRKPDDPEEAPEEEYDPRSLYERLQEQKMAKQEEFEESRRLKNLICALDEDESQFLEMVDRNKMDEEMRKLREEREALEEFRKAIEGLSKDERKTKIEELKNSFSLKSLNVKKPTKRMLNGSLANLIKIKKQPDDSSENKSTSESNQEVLQGEKETDSARTTEKESDRHHDRNQRANSPSSSCSSQSSSIKSEHQTKEILPKISTVKTCLVDYGSDSASESDTGENDESESITDNHQNKKAKTG